MTPLWAQQRDHEVRFDWGTAGASTLGAEAGTVVVVDVLRFTTTVEMAVAAGVVVLPWPWRDPKAARRAAELDAVLADGTDGAPSLCPQSWGSVRPASTVLLPSPNGAACALEAAKGGARVAAGCLRNAASVAAWAMAQGGPVAVIGAGERWPDGTLRPAVEDMLGAGAVIAGLSGSRSPEALAAEAAFTAMGPVEAALRASASGRELTEAGHGDDLAVAAAIDISAVVPVLGNGAFRPA